MPLVASVDMRFAARRGARRSPSTRWRRSARRTPTRCSKGFDSRWTDYLPSTGKRSGAYSTGVYGVHPYQLLNFNGRYEDLTTLAHESGHSMHTFLSYAAQPYPTADYPIFVAEVASTFNENLLIHYMLDRAKDDATRLFLLGTLLDGLRTTLFRQTQFAEFELAFHEQAERGEPLTGENLSKLYLKIARDYYGHDKKRLSGRRSAGHRVGLRAALLLRLLRLPVRDQHGRLDVAGAGGARRGRDRQGKTGKTPRRDAYLKMLSSGSSKYAIDLLKDAGVDMTTSAPFDAAIAEMNGTMDEMERILDRQPKPARRARAEALTRRAPLGSG